VHWERQGSLVSLEQIRAALLQPVFAPFAGRASCSFGLPFDPQIVDAEDIVAAFAQRRPVRPPEVASILRLNLGRAVEVAADEDSGLIGGRIEQRMDGYAGLRAWSSRTQIVTEIANG
jgi:hypothetical protein